jgi:hypothetical protein
MREHFDQMLRRDGEAGLCSVSRDGTVDIDVTTKNTTSARMLDMVLILIPRQIIESESMRTLGACP